MHPAVVLQDEERLKLAELIFSCSVPMAFQAFVKLQIPQILASVGRDTSLSAAEIISLMPASSTSPTAASPAALERILEVLNAYGLVKRVEDTALASSGARRYRTTRMCELLWPCFSPYVLLISDDVFQKSWQLLHESVLHGPYPLKQAHGMSYYEITATNPAFGGLMEAGMASFSAGFSDSILQAYAEGFAKLDGATLVDVGGGTGACLNSIVSAYPGIRGINFDLPHVIANAPDYPGVERVAGDMFESVPEGDAMVMKFILHNWGDEACIRLLKNCHASLPPNGKVIVMDALVGEEQQDDAAARVTVKMDLLMLAVKDGGRERRLSEMIQLASAAGFGRVELLALVDFISILEFHKQ